MKTLLILASALGFSGTCSAADASVLTDQAIFQLPSAEILGRASVPAPAAPVPADRCASLSALVGSKDAAALKTIADAINDPDPAVQTCAIRAAGEAKNELAVDALLEKVDSHIKACKGPYEENLKAKLAAIDSIWSLGEIGSPKVMDAMLKFYDGSDEVLRMNLVIGIGKMKNPKAAPFLKEVAASEKATMATRSVAFEMLAELNDGFRLSSETPSRIAGMEKADIIFSGGLFGIPQSWIKELPIGHSGLFVKTEFKNGKIVTEIMDCVPNYFPAPNGVRRVYAWKNFTHDFKYAFYGNRISKVRPTAAQRENIIRAAAAKVGHKYSNSHTEQQGPDLFDCVGFSEYAYEVSGVNPTPEEYEIGLGWPLTPAEQFAATIPNIAPPCPFP